MPRSLALAAQDPVFLSLQQALAGRYALARELGRGGMGIVYLAHEVRLDRLVAIKLLPPALAADPDTRERFLAEARTAARLAHPHIVPIHAVDVVAEHVFYVMTFVDGESLAGRVARLGPLPPRDVARLLREVSWALAYAHAQGIVHRDVKPDNILLDRESGRAIVADFGIAAAIGPASTGVAGTPMFMSPEQILGKPLDERADVYALGATAFFALTGRAPFEGPVQDVLARHLREPAPSLASVGVTAPRYLAQLVARCLAKAPAERPRDAQQVAERIERGLAARRELPAMLRAFVKRDGRADGIGTVLSIVASFAVGLAASSRWGAETFAVGIHAVWPLAAIGFLVRSARRLVRAGFTHADVVAAFAAEVERAREERQLTSRRSLAWAERGAAAVTRGSFGSAVCVMLVALLRPMSDGEQSVLFTLFFVLATLAWCVGLGWAMLALAQRDDVLVWQRVWRGRLGAAAFAVARRLVRRRGSSRTMTHRATELHLALAAEELLQALPADARQALSAVPPAIERLQARASALKQQLASVDELRASTTADEEDDTLRDERTRIATELEQAVCALEAVRLDLLRLHAGTTSVADVVARLAARTAHPAVGRVTVEDDVIEDVFGGGRLDAPDDGTSQDEAPMVGRGERT